MSEMADQLEVRLAKARRQVEKLTPSLLARARTRLLPPRSGYALSLRENRLACSQHARLAGQLVPQDPTDEPAQRPLKRIESEGERYYA